MNPKVNNTPFSQTFGGVILKQLQIPLSLNKINLPLGAGVDFGRRLDFAAVSKSNLERPLLAMATTAQIPSDIAQSDSRAGLFATEGARQGKIPLALTTLTK